MAIRRLCVERVLPRCLSSSSRQEPCHMAAAASPSWKCLSTTEYGQSELTDQFNAINQGSLPCAPRSTARSKP